MKKTLILFSAFFFILAGAHPLCGGEPVPVLSSQFDGKAAFRNEYGRLCETKRIGRQEIRFGKGVSGSRSIFFGGDLRLEVPVGSAGNEGTVMFWVKPAYPGQDKKVHAFVSLDGGLGSGNLNVLDAPDRQWGRRRLFVEYRPLSMPSERVDDIDSESWTHLAVTWNFCSAGYMRLFVNGELMNHLPLKNKGYRLQPKSLMLGGGRGEYPAESYLDQVKLFSTALTAAAVESVYRGEAVSRPGHRRAWMGSPVKEKTLARDRSGRMIEARILFDEEPYFIKDLNTVLARLRKGRFNVYAPCIWYGGRARWNSRIEAIQADYAEISGKNGKDRLEELIEKAHAMGIQVHPWFCVSKREQKAHPEYADPGMQEGFYNIYRDGFDAFIAGRVEEVAKNYDVDGINLDYVRTGDVSKSLMVEGIYFHKTGRYLLLDSQYRKEHPQFLNMQRERMSDLIRRISESIRRVKPGIVVSVDSKPLYPDASDNQGRNHREWLRQKWIDLVFYMDFQPRLRIFETELDRKGLPNRKQAYVVIGNFEWTEQNAYRPRDPDKLAGLVDCSRARWPGVVAVYLYQQLDGKQIKALSEGPFRERAVADWKAIIR